MKFIDNIKQLGASSHYVTLPADQLKKEGLQKGDYVEVKVRKTEVVSQ